MLLSAVIILLLLIAASTVPLRRDWAEVLTYLAMVAIAIASALLTVAYAQEPPYYHQPNRTLTPGDVATTDAALICEKDYPARSRKVSNSLRTKIYQLHGVEREKCRGDCKIDHLVPLAVGGSNDPKNLWPHEYNADFTVHEKTRLEVLMRKKVCNEGMPPQQAQACFMWDWTQCYEFYYPGQNAARRDRLR